MEEVCCMSAFWVSGSQREQYFCLRLPVFKKQTNVSLQGLADSHCLWQCESPTATRATCLQRRLCGGGLGCSTAARDSTARVSQALTVNGRTHGDLAQYPSPFLFTGSSLRCFLACLCLYYRFILVINDN